MKKTLFYLIIITNILVAQQSSLWDHVPDDIRETKAFKRYENFYRTRAWPADFIPQDHYKAEKRKAVAKYENRGNPEGGNWTNIGPNGIVSTWPEHWGMSSGRVRGIAVHPSDPLIVYAGAASGGLWKTTDGGLTWIDLAENFVSLSFGAIEIDPSNPQIVYAGSGEAVAGGYPLAYTGDGIYKTTDGGASWTNINDGFGEYTIINAVDVSPHNSSRLFAAFARGYSMIGNPDNQGIWKSTDAGLNWYRTLDVEEAFDVMVHPVNPDVVYASSGGYYTTAGFYISTDGGENWNKITEGLPSSASIGRMQIGIAQSDPDILYLYIRTNLSPSSLRSKVYKSTDGGYSWNHISEDTPLGGSYNGSSWNDQGTYDLCIGVSPADPNYVLVGNVEIHKTRNGSDFSPLRNPNGPYGGNSAWDSPMHVDYHKIVFSPSDPDYIYVGSDGGLFVSTDGGTNWESRNEGLRTIQYYRLSSSPADINTYIGGAQDNGNFGTENGPDQPWLLASTGDGMENFFDRDSPTTMFFMSTQNGNLIRFENYQTTGISPSYSSNTYWTTPFFMHPVNNDWIYVASQRLWRSTNKGDDWEAVSDIFASSAITTVSQNPSYPDMMICASGGFYITDVPVYISEDGGINWRNVSQNIPGPKRQIPRVVAHPVEENTVYVVRSGFGSGKIYESTNMGQSWQDISSDLPDVPYNDLFIDPVNPDWMFMGGDLGVYHTQDRGQSWVRSGTGMPFTAVHDFSYYDGPGGRKLRAATHGRSAYEIALDEVVPVELINFSARASGKSVELNWTTATELNNFGFEVERKYISTEWSAIGFIRGHGTTSRINHYSFIDDNVSGKICYRIKQIDFDGNFEYSSVSEVTVSEPSEFQLIQNYPNPFNPSTRIMFSLGSESSVRLSVFNVLGEEIDILINKKMMEGFHEVIWNGKNQPSGIYFCKLACEGQRKVMVKKMILQK